MTARVIAWNRLVSVFAYPSGKDRLSVDRIDGANDGFALMLKTVHGASSGDYRRQAVTAVER